MQGGEVSPIRAVSQTGKVGVQGDDCSEASTTEIATPSPADDSAYPCSSTLSAPPTTNPSLVGTAPAPTASASHPPHPLSAPRELQPRPTDPKQLPNVPRLLTHDSAALLATREASGSGRSSITAAHRPDTEARSDLLSGAAFNAGAVGRNGAQCLQEGGDGGGEVFSGESEERSSGGAVSGGKRRRSAAEESEEVRVNRAAAARRMRDVEVLALSQSIRSHRFGGPGRFSARKLTGLYRKLSLLTSE